MADPNSPISKTASEAVKFMRENKDGGDTEIAHSRADEYLCELLHLHGQKDVVEAFRAMDKWYA